MKVIVFLAICLCVPVYAHADSKDISVETDYFGNFATFLITSAKSEMSCRVSYKGIMEDLEIVVRVKNEKYTRLEYRIIFDGHMAIAVEARSYNNVLLVNKQYTRHTDKAVFVSAEKLAKKIMKKYDLAKFAKSACKKQKEFLKKTAEKENREKMERTNELPAPEKIFENFFDL